MPDDRRLPVVVRDQVARFSAKLSAGLKRPLQKFIGQMLSVAIHLENCFIPLDRGI